jgi:hypothetical protein
MKTAKWFRLLLTLASLHTARVHADDLFQLFWRGTYYTKNSTGHIVAVGFSEQTVINQVAQSTGINPGNLVFVYRPNKRDVAVVQSNGALVASIVQMQATYTDVVNPSGNVVVRHALLNDQTHSVALGSFFGLELRTFNSSGALVNDSLIGTVLYSKSEVPGVFGAQVSTGARVVDTTNAP